MTDNIGIARVTPLVSFTVADVPLWSLPEPTDGLALRWDAVAAAWVDCAPETPARRYGPLTTDELKKAESIRKQVKLASTL